MKFALVLLVALAILNPLCALAAIVTGVVVDDQGHPIPDVAITVETSSAGVASASDGTFRLDLDLSQPRRLTFRHISFKPQMISVTSDSSLRIELAPSVYPIQGVTVTADRAETGKSPVAFTDFTSREIARDYTIGEFPLLLETTPNVYAYSDAGGGLGYSYLKIRGFDDKRVSIYINGIPLNDPEDQSTYFVDIPDFAANVKDIQVQRGIGSSLYGDAAFGGSVNIVSAAIEQPRNVALTTGYGGFWDNGKWVGDMQKQSLEYQSGLIDGRWNFAGRYSRQLSDGYRKNSWYDGWAYHLSLSRLDPRMTTTVNFYGGPMKMHLAYYGISSDQLTADRRFNPLTYDNETDNFNQPHYELHNAIKLNEHATLQNTLFHIHGSGFYEQYKDARDFYDYAIPITVVRNGDGDSIGVITSGDLVRQQHVTKNQWGWNPRLEFSQPRGALSLGGSFYYFESEHWGQVVWAEGVTNSIDPRHRYYEYFGTKYFASLYANQSYQLTDRVNLTGSLQMRHQRFSLDQTRMGAFTGYDYDLDWTFLSPRVGVTYSLNDEISLLASYSLSSRVPADWEIYDAGDPYSFPSLSIKSIERNGSGDSIIVFGDPTAKSERVHNFELGINYRTQQRTCTANLFWMEFSNEIVPYGGLNEMGLPITTNVDRSVHAGIELAGASSLTDKIRLSGNFSYNYNRIKKFAVTETVYDNDSDYDFVESRQFSYDNKTIAGFPSYIGNLIGEYTAKRFQFVYRARFVGRIYVENNNVQDLAIAPYFISSVSAGINLGRISSLGRLEFSARVDNIFDKSYESSGYGGATRFADIPDQYWSEYIPAAGRSIFTTLKLELQ